jgi:co-chaperonin GroES (HSP10)
MSTETLTELEKQRRLRVLEKETRPKNFGDVFDADGKLDNAVLDSTLSMIPTPTGWRIAVLPYRGVAQTKGGIALTRETQDKAAVATTCAYVLKLGPLAYRDETKFPDGPWCKEGDWIIFGRYAGARIQIDGGEIRLLNDDEIIGTVNSPDDVLHF